MNLQGHHRPRRQNPLVSQALPGRNHDLTADRRHRIIATCVRLGPPVLANPGYVGAAACFRCSQPATTPPRSRRRPAADQPGPHQALLPRRTWHRTAARPGRSSAMPAAAPPGSPSQSHPHPGELPLKTLNGITTTRPCHVTTPHCASAITLQGRDEKGSVNPFHTCSGGVNAQVRQGEGDVAGPLVVGVVT
ncbi:hypothetical protein ACFVFP_42540, partial [Streptomyces sp. NPDC057686]